MPQLLRGRPSGLGGVSSRRSAAVRPWHQTTVFVFCSAARKQPAQVVPQATTAYAQPVTIPAKEGSVATTLDQLEADPAQFRTQPASSSPVRGNITPFLRSSPTRPEPLTHAEQGVAHLFGYGINSTIQCMAKNGIKVHSRDGAFIRDKNVRIVFQHRGGTATLRLSSNDTDPKPMFPPMLPNVHGVLYKLTTADLKRLAKRERAAGYELHEIEVETYDGKVMQAQAFVSSPFSLLREEVVPTEAYLSTLREGAADNWLHPMHQAWLSSVETVTSAGLSSDYFNTPARAVSYSLLLVAAVMLSGFLLHA